MSIKIVIGNKTYSSWSLRAWLPLRKTGIIFSEVQLWLDTPEFEHEIAKYSPTRRVPVLHDNFFLIHDSLAIGEYLADKYPNSGLWPADTAHRAYARAISCEMHAGFEALRSELPFNCRASGRHVTPSPQCDNDIARIQAIWTSCRNSAKDGPWLFGSFSIADAMYAPIASRFRTYDVELSDVAADYVETVMSDDDMLAWMEAAKEETAVIETEERGAG